MYSNDNKVVFIGGIYPNDIRNELLGKGAVLDMAGHTFGNAIITGLYELGVNYTLISSPYIKWGKNHISYTKGISFKSIDNKETKDIWIGDLNLPFLRMLFEFYKVRKHLKKELKSDKDSSVIIHSLHSPFLLAYFTLWGINRKNCVIVTDLQQFMSGNKSILYRLAKAIDRVLTNICLSKINAYVLLTSSMLDKLPYKHKKWVTVEGIFNSRIDRLSSKEHCREGKTILYSGGISKRYGVFDLIEAFVRIPNPDYRLSLCGSCDDMALMNSYQQKDHRIKYLGLVDKDMVYELQQNATLLVNPRHSNEEFTKYSFPSKTMEYLASGTPTLMCDLPCLPEEYKQYMFIFDDESIDGYSRKIMEVCAKDSKTLLEFGRQAAQFIMTQKNELIQTRKILDLLYSE